MNLKNEETRIETMEKDVAESKHKSTWLPIRFLVAFLAFIGFTFNYMLRVNINLTIHAMVNYTALNESETSGGSECVPNRTDDGDIETDSEAIYEWDSVVRSQVIGAFFYGYIVTQVPGGRLAEMYGAKWLLALCLAAVSALTLLIPISCKAAEPDEFPWLLVTIRALMGIAEGATFPCMHAMLAKWSPVFERSRLSALIYAGSQFGTIIAFPVSGLISDQLGWQWVFYLQGGACFVWVLLWIICVTNTPTQHPWISKEEVQYIEDGLEVVEDHVKAPPIPWTHMFRSMPFWAIFVANFGNNWGFHLLMTEIPEYMATMLGKDIEENALISTLPYACMWVFSFLFGFVFDKLYEKKCLTRTWVRKIATFVAHAFPAMCLVGICFAECNENLTIALLTIGVNFQGALYTGFFVNPLDIASNYAGTILGITNGFGNIPGWLAPLTAGAFTQGSQTLASWRKVWYVAIAIYLFDAIFFLIFGSGEEQYWNTIYVNDNSKSDISQEKDINLSIERRSERSSSLIDDRNTYDVSQTQKIPRAKLD